MFAEKLTQRNLFMEICTPKLAQRTCSDKLHTDIGQNYSNREPTQGILLAHRTFRELAQGNSAETFAQRMCARKPTQRTCEETLAQTSLRKEVCIKTLRRGTCSENLLKNRGLRNNFAQRLRRETCVQKFVPVQRRDELLRRKTCAEILRKETFFLE